MLLWPTILSLLLDSYTTNCYFFHVRPASRPTITCIAFGHETFGHFCLNMRDTPCIHKVKVKWSRYRPGVAQMVGRGIALLCHDRGTRREWVVSSTPRLHFAPGKDPVPIVQEDGWAPGPVWTGGKFCPHWDSFPDSPARSQSLYRLS